MRYLAVPQSARDLGIYVDCDLSMRTRVQRIVSRCFAALRQLRQIRRSVPSATLQMLVVALVHSWLDYGNGVLVGLPAHLMRRLQSVLKAAARLRTRDHITDTLISLHWLRAPERIQYKLAILAHRVLHGDAPRYLGQLVCVDDLPGRRPVRSSNTNRLVVSQVKSSTVGSRALAVAAPDIWNRLPPDVVAADSLSTFRRLLKRFLFRQSYPDVVYWHHPISEL